MNSWLIIKYLYAYKVIPDVILRICTCWWEANLDESYGYDRPWNQISSAYLFCTVFTLLIRNECTNLPLANGFPRDGGFKGDGLWDVPCCRDSLLPSVSCDGRRYTGLGDEDTPNGVGAEVAQLKFDNPPNAGFIANGLLPKVMLLTWGEAGTNYFEYCQQRSWIIMNTVK
jgi:hypothetical protein